MPDAAVKTDFQVDVRFALPELEQITREAVTTLSKELQAKERQDIASSPQQRFSKRTRTSVRKLGEQGWEIQVRAHPGWMRVWEYGGEAVGTPMLWFPAPNSGLGHYTRARKLRGQLWRPPGKNVLIFKDTGKIAFIGVPAVRFQPNLNMRQVAEEEAQKFAANLQSYIHA